jgi:hypothetical protein
MPGICMCRGCISGIEAIEISVGASLLANPGNFIREQARSYKKKPGIHRAIFYLRFTERAELPAHRR